MKRFCCLAAVLLLGGSASCYRTVNELACFMDTWARSGRRYSLASMRLTRKWPDFKRSRLKQGGSMFIGQFSVHVDLGSTAVRWIMPEQRPTTMGYPFDVEVYAPRRFRVHLRCGGAHHRAPPRFGTDRFDCAYLHLRLRLCGSMYLEMKRIK